MRIALNVRTLGVLQRTLRVLFALAVLGALAPPAISALAAPAAGIAGASGCCDAPPPTAWCDGLGAACPQSCQPVLPSAPDEAQISTFAAVWADAGERAHVAVLRPVIGPLNNRFGLSGPPPFLLFHRFLL